MTVTDLINAVTVPPELANEYPWSHEEVVLTKNKWIVLLHAGIPKIELDALKKSKHLSKMLEKGHWCAYTAIPKSMLPREWRDGSSNHPGIDFLNIHGGITFRAVTANFVIYGLDCGHAGDEDNEKLFETEYVFLLALQMRKQLLKLAEVQRTYKRAKLNTKLRILYQVRTSGKIKEEFGMAANLHILTGIGGVI